MARLRVREWVGVMGLPFDSGHVLALRVFPENDFSPYRTVWHRNPAGEWSIHVDGSRLDTACPRYYGAASREIAFGHVDLNWIGPATLRVVLDTPSLEWTLTASQPRMLRFLNAVSEHLPLWTWKPPTLIHARERLAARMGMGELELSGMMPSGHKGTLMPQRMYYIEESKAVFEGVDLGRPAHVDSNPTIGTFPLPARGVLAIGQAVWGILDPIEYERTRSETAD